MSREPIPVDAGSTREAIPVGSMMLLPAAPGTCPVCATKHEPDQAHNVYSLFYGVRFQGLHGRSPTWADAVAHLPPATQALWKKAVDQTQNATWTEPPEGVAPIAESGDAGQQAADVTPAQPGPPQATP